MKSDDITRLERSLAEAGARLRGPETQMMEAARAAQRAMRPHFEAASSLAKAWREVAERERSFVQRALRELEERQRLADVITQRTAEHRAMESLQQVMERERLQAESFRKMIQREHSLAESYREVLRRERDAMEPLRRAVERYRPAMDSICRMVDQERAARDSVRQAFGRERSAAESMNRILAQQRAAVEPIQRLVEQEERFLAPLRAWQERHAASAQLRDGIADRFAAIAAAVPNDDVPVTLDGVSVTVDGTTYTPEDLEQVAEDHVFGQAGILTIPLEQLAEYMRRLPRAVAWLLKEMVKHYLMVILVCLFTHDTGLEPEVVARRLAHLRKTEIRQIMREPSALGRDASSGCVNAESLDAHVAPRRRSQKTATLAYPQVVKMLQFGRKKRWVLVQWQDADGGTRQGWVLARFILRGIEMAHEDCTENE